MPELTDGEATELALAADRISELERRITDLEDECSDLRQQVTMLDEQLELVRFAARPLP